MRTVHIDSSSGNTIKHRKGDWKLDDEGKFHLEKLGKRFTANKL